jgi:glycogen operon protein
MFNSGTQAVDFRLPPGLPDKVWHLAVDTSHDAPQDLFAEGDEPLWRDPQTYRLPSRSSAILLTRATERQKPEHHHYGDVHGMP